MDYLSGRHFLQRPGPTNVPDPVLRALSRPTIDHRGPEFSELARRVLQASKRIFQTEETVIISMFRRICRTLSCEPRKAHGG